MSRPGLDEIARQLNGRRGRTLDSVTPAEKINKLLVAAPGAR